MEDISDTDILTLVSLDLVTQAEVVVWFVRLYEETIHEH